MPQRVYESVEQIRSMVGQEMAVSDWIEVTQPMIDGFADVTRDTQWIHVDTERAARESPFGTTIAHGFLTLSLMSYLHNSSFLLNADRKMAIFRSALSKNDELCR